MSPAPTGAAEDHTAPTGAAEDHTADTRATYDRIADRYAEQQASRHPDNDRLVAALETAFVAVLPPAGRVADLGCGPGFDAARLTARGARVVGIDLSAGMLSTARRSLPGRLAHADLRALPVADGGLDGLWSVAALLHVPEHDTVPVLSEWRRALRAGGSLALVTALGPSSRFEDVPYAPSERRWFVYRRHPRLRAQLQSARFEVDFEEEIAGTRRWWTALARAV